MNTETLIRDVKGNLLIGASRVSLQNVIAAHRRGETPEQIHENFPSLTLAEVYGAIVYYLEHQESLDQAFGETARILDEVDAANRAAHADFFDSMRNRFDAAQSRPDSSSNGNDEARRE